MRLNEFSSNLLVVNAKLWDHEFIFGHFLLIKVVLVPVKKQVNVVALEVSYLFINELLKVEFKALLVNNLKHFRTRLNCLSEEKLFL